MEKSYQIQVGNSLIINKVGFLLAILGVLFALVVFLVLFAGNYLPSEINYFGFIGRNVYLSLVVSIAVVVFGLWLSDVRSYSESVLKLEDRKVSFRQKGELVELDKWMIQKIIKRKSTLHKSEKIRIKTTVGKEYDLKVNQAVLRNLQTLFPYKVKFNQK